MNTPEGQFVIPKGHINGAMDGDLVEIVRKRSLEYAHISSKKRKSMQKGSASGPVGAHEMFGSVQSVLERAHATMIGIYHDLDGLAVVRPIDTRINHDVFIDKAAKTELASVPTEGDGVVVRILKYHNKMQAATGYVEEIISDRDVADLQYESIAIRHHIEEKWPQAALEQAKGVLDDVRCGNFTDEFPERRRDLTSRLIFTIDPDDAKDFDDAISLEYIEHPRAKVRLGVHIADVSAYVPFDSSLDLEARKRSTSTYLPDRVIPMLPAELSEGLCSLQPHENKLAVTVDMLVSADGGVVDTKIYTSLICSSARLTYAEVQDVLDAPASAADPMQPKRPHESKISTALRERLVCLNELAVQLKQRRLDRGAIDFESVEAKVELNAEGQACAVKLRKSTQATRMIEEAMILANEQVTIYALQKESSFIYRIHEEPYVANLVEILPTLKEFGYVASGIPRTSKEIQAILDKSKGKPEHILISRLLLRAMMRALYSAQLGGHFGLASSAYTHFTSPIRRYPDLMVHRLLKKILFYGGVPKIMSKSLDLLAAHCTVRERDCERAAMEALQFKLCEYLKTRCGELFFGVIVFVSNVGLIVREDSTTAEGLISASELGADFIYDMEKNRYRDILSGKSYRLGQPLRIKLIGIDEQNQRLQFVVA